MSKNSLDVVRETVRKDGFFEVVVASVSDWDEALDRRDAAVFDKAWSSAFEKLKALEYSSAEDEVAVNEIREFVFKKVHSLTASSDIASYISDDMGLVADSYLKSCDIEWVKNYLRFIAEGGFLVSV
ncbi:hypothetical protein QEL93_004388 [Pseudomonas putida]|nr:hypothetical protein [Pseudomonas putida]